MSTYRDIRTGKFAKYDGRKKKYLRKVTQPKLDESPKVKVTKLRDKFGDVGRRRSSRDEQFARLGFVEKFEIERSGNEDLYNYFGRQKLNSKIAEFEKNKPSDKHVVVATVEIASNRSKFPIVTREVNLSANDIKFLEGSKRRGRKYDYKDVLTRHIHQVLDERGLTPYTSGVSDGRKVKKRKSRKKKFGSKQVYTIRLRYAGPRSLHGADDYKRLREDAS